MIDRIRPANHEVFTEFFRTPNDSPSIIQRVYGLVDQCSLGAGFLGATSGSDYPVGASEEGILIGSNIFKIEHVWLPTSFRKDSQFSIVTSNSINDHPNSEKAQKVLSHLKDVYDPWGSGDIDDFSKQLFLERLGFKCRPPVTSLIACAEDFPNEIHGNYASLVGDVLLLKYVDSVYDLPLIVVFGEKVWDYMKFQDRTFNTLVHEESHLLTLIAIYQEYIRTHQSFEQDSVSNSLGMPVWEGIADVFCNRIRYSFQEYFFWKEGLLENISFEDLLINSRNRSLGNVLVVMNALLFQLSLGISYNEINNYCKVKKKLENQLLYHSLQLNNSSGEVSKGWLTKQLFPDLFDAASSIQDLPLSTVESYLNTIVRDIPYNEEALGIFMQQWPQAVKDWDILGKDILG